MAVLDAENAARYGTVQMDARGRVTGFLEKTRCETAGVVNGGVYVFDRAVLDFVGSHVFDPADFVIRSDGVCRLNPEMARMVVARVST